LWIIDERSPPTAMTTFAVIAGGGTSGHVLPAIAIAESLVDSGIDLQQIYYTGAQRGIETDLIPPTAIRHTFFDVVGLSRSISLKALRNNFSFASRLFKARRQAVALFKNELPKVVVSVGGYASLPAVLAARKLDIPIVVVSYDRIPGRSSKLTSRFAQATAVAFPSSELRRAVMTGAPVRRVIRNIDRVQDRSAARRRLGVADDSFFIGVIGGSLGSLMLNNAVSEFVKEFKDDSQLALRHVVGPRFMKSYTNPIADSEATMMYQVVAYEENMADIYASVDLLIGRGGAGTIADVATAGVPAILIPWKDAADDHQTANVQYLSESGAAILLLEEQVERDLSRTIVELRSDSDKLQEISARAFEIGGLNRQGTIATVIQDVANGRRV
jgi:UDP-N-acetylglucosamine--N-acetylmuramyl-(pentapeptide) pyrophosphoryl-undecaprenol N-acetylglucosamine transferase